MNATYATEAELKNEVSKEESLLQVAVGWVTHWTAKFREAESAYHAARETVQEIGVRALALARTAYEKAMNRLQDAKARAEQHATTLKELYQNYREFITPYTVKQAGN